MITTHSRSDRTPNIFNLAATGAIVLVLACASGSASAGSIHVPGMIVVNSAPGGQIFKSGDRFNVP